MILLACVICLCETLYGHTISWFFSPSRPLLNSFFPLPNKPHLLCTSHTTNHKYFFLFYFLSRQNELLVHSRYNWEDSPPHTHTHTNSLILSFKSKDNDFWMPPRTFKGKHPVYKSDIVTFQIWPVRIRLSLFTKLLRKYSLNLHYLWVCLRTYTKTFNGEEFF